MRLQQRLAATLELAERAQRARERDPHVDLPLAVVARQQPQRRLEPVRRRRGRASRRRDAGVQQQHDRVLVAAAGGLLDVMRALGGRGAAGRQRRRRARVGRELPAARRRLVDRAAHDRMAEDEAPRHRRRAHQVQRQEPVERGEALRRRQLRDRRRQVGLERLAGDGGGVQQRVLGRRKGSELLGQRRRHGGRHPGRTTGFRIAVERRAQPPLPARSRELLEVERVAAAVAVDRRHRSRIEPGQQLARLGLVERRERDPSYRRHGERGRQGPRGTSRAERERQQDGSLDAATQQRREQLDRRAVAPVQVVEHEHERPRAREEAEQAARRAVSAIALVGDRVADAGAGPAQRRKQLGELGDQLGVPRLAQTEIL